MRAPQIRDAIVRGMTKAGLIMMLLLAWAFIPAFVHGETAAPSGTEVRINQTASEAHITPSEWDQILDLLDDDSESDWERERAAELRFRRVPLSDTKAESILVQSISEHDCGATGNCTVWVVRETNGKLELALNGTVADDVRVQNEKSSGLANLVIRANQSANENMVEVFAFDGQRYAAHNCYRETLAEGGTEANSIQPVICN